MDRCGKCRVNERVRSGPARYLPTEAVTGRARLEIQCSLGNWDFFSFFACRGPWKVLLSFCAGALLRQEVGALAGGAQTRQVGAKPRDAMNRQPKFRSEGELRRAPKIAKARKKKGSVALWIVECRKLGRALPAEALAAHRRTCVSYRWTASIMNRESTR